MDKLPQELLHNIFIQLPITQKQECIFVCQKWRNIIQSRSLFHTVYLYSFELLKDFTILLQQEPKIVPQVERLFLYRSAPRELDKRMFTIFPNLKEIQMWPIHPGILKSPNDYIFNDHKLKGLPFTDGLVEHIRDFDECELTRLLITHGLCFHLTTLELNLNVLGSSPSAILPLLKDMPVLKHLSLEESPLTMDVIEAIHTNIPSLTSIKLLNVKLLPCALPVKIVPVTLLTKLDVFSGNHITQEKFNWFQYIAKKYTCLKHFEFIIPSSYYNGAYTEAYTTQFPLILQNLGPQLESLTLSDCLDQENRILKSIDHYGCQVKNLILSIIDDGNKAFSILSKTKQFKLVERFSISKLDFNSTLEKLREMEKLKSLKLHFLDYEPEFEHEGGDSDFDLNDLVVDFDRLFQYFPKSVDSVEIECSILDYNDSVQDEYSQIKKLIIRNAYPNKRIEEFISKRLPNLESLALFNFQERNLNLVLPNHHLAFLCISNVANTPINLCLITTTDNNTRYYTTSKTYYKNYSQLDSMIPPVTKDDLGEQPIITVLCRSIGTLVLGLKNAFLTSDKYEFQSLIR